MALTVPQSLFQAGVTDRLFRGALQGNGERLFDALWELFPSTLRIENHAFAGPPPMLSVYQDEIRFGELYDSYVRAGNQTFISGIRAKREDIEDDQVSGIMRRAMQLGTYANLLPNQLFASALDSNSQAGPITFESATQNYFSTTHPDLGGGVQSNNLTGSGLTTAGVATDLHLAFGALIGFKDNNAQPLNAGVSDIAILFGPALHRYMLEAVNAEIIPVAATTATSNSPVSNVQFEGKRILLIESPRLASNTDPNDWFMFNTTGNPSKPFIWQLRAPLTVEVLGPGSDTYSRLQEWNFIARMRGTLAPGHPLTAIRVHNT